MSQKKINNQNSTRTSENKSPETLTPKVQLKQLRGLPFEVQRQSLKPPAIGSKDKNQTKGGVRKEAAKGIRGGGTALPFANIIQKSFGAHNLSGVRAHIGPGATQNSNNMGAKGYTAGNHIVFSGVPSLHTAAHEAAHIIQQRGGIKLSGGVGEDGDEYEKNADAVADQVVAGKSAEDLLNKMAPKVGKNSQTDDTLSGVQLKRSDTYQNARRRAYAIKDALLDHWTEDEQKALRQIRGQSGLMVREIRAQYKSITDGRILESDYKEYCNNKEYQEALSLIWQVLSIEDRVRTNIEKGWLWNSENEEGILDVLKNANTNELRKCRHQKSLMNLLRSTLNDDQYYEAQKMMTPKEEMYKIVVERIKNAEGFFNDNEKAVYNVLLDLTIADRKRIWKENKAIFSFLNPPEDASVRRMCLGTEADALDERMTLATSGLGTDDDAVDLVVDKTRTAAQEEEVITNALKPDSPQGENLSEQDKKQLQERLDELGKIKENLLTAKEDEDGNLKENTFLGRLHDDVGNQEFQSFGQTMGADQFLLAKQQILDAIGTFNDDEASINEAFEKIIGEIKIPVELASHKIDDETRTIMQQDANRKLRKKLLNDPDVKKALTHLNKDELGDVDTFVSADTFQIALKKLTDAFEGVDTDEKEILKIIVSMNSEDRAKLKKDRSIYIKLTSSGWLTKEEKELIQIAIDTGKLPTEKALDWAFGGWGDGTREEVINNVFSAMTDEDRFPYRLGYWLFKEKREPADEAQRKALKTFTELYARMEKELGDDDLQTGMDNLIGIPSPAELLEEEGRVRAASIMSFRIQDKQNMSDGLAGAFTSTDETKDQAAVQYEALFKQAMEDKKIDEKEIAALAALDQNFAERYQTYIATVDQVAHIAGMAAAIAVGIAVTFFTGGASGPAVGSFLAKYGAATLIGGISGAAAKVGVSEAMAGDHFDAFSTEGGVSAVTGFADGAMAVLSAGLAAHFTRLAGLGGGALASETTVGIMRSTGSALAVAGKQAPGAVLRGAIDGCLAGAVGEVIFTLADEDTWKKSAWDVICNVGLSLLKGGFVGGVTGGVTGGAFETLSAYITARRLPALIMQLNKAGIGDKALDELTVEAAQLLGRMDNALAQGDILSAKNHLKELQGHIPDENLDNLQNALLAHRIEPGGTYIRPKAPGGEETLSRWQTFTGNFPDLDQVKGIDDIKNKLDTPAIEALDDARIFLNPDLSTANPRMAELRLNNLRRVLSAEEIDLLQKAMMRHFERSARQRVKFDLGEWKEFLDSEITDGIPALSNLKKSMTQLQGPVSNQRFRDLILHFRSELLSDPSDIKKVCSAVQDLGVNLDEKVIKAIKQYNFEAPGITFNTNTVKRWTRLANQQGTLEDVSYIVHEAKEIAALKQIRKNTGFDFMGKNWGRQSAQQRTLWRQQFMGHYMEAHSQAITEEYKFMARQLRIRTAGEINFENQPAFAICTALEDNAADLVQVQHGITVGEHENLALWKSIAQKTQKLSPKILQRFGYNLDARPTIEELLSKIKNTKVDHVR